jgi:hypothetical protein
MNKRNWVIVAKQGNTISIIYFANQFRPADRQTYKSINISSYSQYELRK